jgi:hypothetical protein
MCVMSSVGLIENVLTVDFETFRAQAEIGSSGFAGAKEPWLVVSRRGTLGSSGAPYCGVSILLCTLRPVGIEPLS